MDSFLGATLPEGAGGVDFLSVGGVPFLTDVNSGRFNGAHAPRMFFEMYAPEGSHEFYCVKKHLKPNVDLAGCWRMLIDAGLAFVPGTSNAGVFPVLFLHGLKVQLLVIAQSIETRDKIILDCNSVLDCDHVGRLPAVVCDHLALPPAFVEDDYTRQLRKPMANTMDICAICL